MPVTAANAIPMWMARVAAREGSPTAFSFYQLLAIGFVGIFIFIFGKRYRDGFLYRIKHQGKKFLGLSLFNETFAESSFWLSNIAVALAPVGAYVSAMNGVQSLFVLVLLWFLPIGERSKVTKTQWIAVTLIFLGAFLLERR
ncbi:EamA family transporter [Patescibacteria group bacterium]|nr:EamA family transporter [Patescibacteria group bacterium]